MFALSSILVRASLYSLFVQTTGLSFVTASPLVQNEKRAPVDCANLAAVFDESCWLPREQGGIDPAKYLADPTTGWIYTTPKCAADTAAGVDCCEVDEPWTTCFIRLGRGVAGADCSTVNAQHCTWDHELSPKLDPSIAAEVRYVLKNIYDINNFFTTYYNALQFAGLHAAQSVAGLTTTFDGIDPQVPGGNILWTMAAGLAFLGLPEVAAVTSTLTTVARLAAEALTIGIQQAPGLAKLLWPTGTVDSQLLQIAGLDATLTAVQSRLETQLDAALAQLMSDVPTFIAFAGSGAFSGRQSLSLPKETKDLDLALKTYLTSESLRQNEWFGWYVGQRSDIPADGCVDFGGGLTCSGSIWIRATQREYFLKHRGGGGYPGAKIQAIMENQWADLTMLFDGSWNCTAAGLAGGSLVHLGPDNRLDLSCISQMPIYLEGQEHGPYGRPCPAAAPDGTCYFGYHSDYGEI